MRQEGHLQAGRDQFDALQRELIHKEVACNQSPLPHTEQEEHKKNRWFMYYGLPACYDKSLFFFVLETNPSIAS